MKSFAASTQGVALERELRSTQDTIKAEIRSWSGAVSTQSVNGASDLEYSYTTVLNGFSMKMPYGDIARARELDGVKRIFVAEQYSLPTTFGEDEYTISMTSSTGMVGPTRPTPWAMTAPAPSWPFWIPALCRIMRPSP